MTDIVLRADCLKNQSLLPQEGARGTPSTGLRALCNIYPQAHGATSLTKLKRTESLSKHQGGYGDVTSKTTYVYYWWKSFQIAELPLFHYFKKTLFSSSVKKGERLDNYIFITLPSPPPPPKGTPLLSHTLYLHSKELRQKTKTNHVLFLNKEFGLPKL